MSILLSYNVNSFRATFGLNMVAQKQEKLTHLSSSRWKRYVEYIYRLLKEENQSWVNKYTYKIWLSKPENYINNKFDTISQVYLVTPSLLKLHFHVSGVSCQSQHGLAAATCIHIHACICIYMVISPYRTVYLLDNPSMYKVIS